MCGPPERTSALRNTTGSPSSKRTSITRSSACPKRPLVTVEMGRRQIPKRGQMHEEGVMQRIISIASAILLCAAVAQAEDLGNLSANPYNFDSSRNPFG